MISLHDLYTVLSAVIPLYVAMILAYGSVRWWKILTPEQCSGINRFVAVFAVPLLSFHFIASNNPYHMNAKYIVADVAQKLVVLLALALWAWFSSAGSLEWLITIFMLATLPNTLVMGIPLLQSMYGGHADTLMVQFVVMQSIIWYTILLFLYEYRAAKVLIMAQFPDGTAASIVDFKVDSDVHSIDGREAIDTEAQVREDGTIVVNVRRSVSSRSDTVTPRTSMHMRSMPSSKALTPRPSNLSGIDIYSMHSSVNLTPRESNFTHAEFFSMTAGPGGRLHSTSSPRQSNFNSSDAYSLHSSRAPTPRTSNANEDICNHPKTSLHPSGHSPRYPAALYAPGPNSLLGRGLICGAAPAFDGSSPASAAQAARKSSAAAALVSEPRLSCASPKLEQDGRELHMFVWSAAASPTSEAGLHVFGDENGRHDVEQPKEMHLLVKSSSDPYAAATLTAAAGGGAGIGPDFSFGSRPHLFIDESLDMANNSKHGPSSIVAATSKILESTPSVMPAPKVMAKLILTMAWKKLIRNPNTYASSVGIVWSLIAFKFHISMPAIVENSVTILSDAGLGMAMFSLGLFMALQKRIIVCGPQLAAFAMVVRFLTGPAVMAAASIAVGLRGRELHIAIVQAALPQGIVPFVFAKEYDLHPDILSTAVIFGMLIALPITLVYYVAMGI